ncbi:hypothetical protein J5F27_06485 [Schleiferilactobacillus harbinensis]|uniref:hypothetical protein n=1 Tax=Schleiferilactobacillus harbinensis TaxID=304207 RepID=UPI001AAFD12B|nr:hypothetical protein [Schleiferilactobacillus harbinensis]MBO3091567.1 hypothetical protein [Schleiferilactobacillus harbinensis]
MNDFIKAVAPVLQILVPVVLTYIAYLQFAKKSKHDETHDLIEGYKQQIAGLQQQLADVKKSQRDETNDLIAGYKQQLASVQQQLDDMYQKFLSSEKLVDEQRRELNERKKDDE